MVVSIEKNRLKYTETEVTSIQSEKNLLSAEELMSIYPKIIQETEQELLDFYQPLLDEDKYYEAIMTQSVQIELLLRKLISLKMGCETNTFKKSSLYDLINVAFILELIYEDQGKLLHEIRNFRNKFAHEFLASLNMNQEEMFEMQGKIFVSIIDINDMIKELESGSRN